VVKPVENQTETLPVSRLYGLGASLFAFVLLPCIQAKTVEIVSTVTLAIVAKIKKKK
jgi:hypothetical protein